MMRRGSILLVVDDYTFNPITRAIEGRTGECYHSANYIGDGKITESLVKSGVVENPLAKYFDGKSNVLVCQPKEEYFSDDVIDEVCDRWLAEVGMPYDYNNIVGKLLFRHSSLFNSEEKRICIEHTLKGYTKKPFMDRESEECSPNDVYKFMLATNGKYFDCDYLYNLIKARGK